MRIAVVGFGYWGPNIARVLRSEGCEVIVTEIDPLRRAAAEEQGFRVRSQWNPEARDIDAVAICTAPSTHFSLALPAIRAGLDVLVTKPLALSVEEADLLIDEANSRGVALIVDHTFVYSPAVIRLMKEFQDCEPTFYDSARLNLGTTASGENVIWDLGSHDVSIMLQVVGSVPREVRAVTNGIHQAHIDYRFDNGLIAHSHLSWIAPAKIRQTIVGCNTKMVVYDDISSSEKIRIYSIGSGRDSLLDYRLGDMVSPALSTEEPLRLMVRDFIRACEWGTVDPLGVDVVRVLEAAQEASGHDDWVDVS